ncbi:MAG: hypothetical protein BZ138_03290 [Methanosphaera sp. rholeuAM270]|nr:MAG: hypothetical protein BZ138_03290 [Methanosphaera sp. rholeuAM270]
MNYNKHIFSIIIIMLILVILPFTYATGTYSLPEVKETINVEDNGLATITDEYTYSIEGTVNGVTRTIPLSGQQSIADMQVETPGYYNTLEIENQNNQVTVKVWLYKDEAKTQKVSDENVKVIYNYKFEKGVKIYNDIAELQYMSWGKGWNKPLESLTTVIKIPGKNDETEYWNNPSTYVKNSAWTKDDELTTVYKDIPEETSVEQRILMPKSYFKSNEYADVINKDAKEQIEKDQEEYNFQENIKNYLGILFSLLSVILMIVPLGMYIKWGRNPKITYQADYESQIPTDDSPVFVNAMIAGIVDELTPDAFTSTLLDLIDRQYYKIVISSKDDTVIRRYNRDTDGLKLHELDIIDFLRQFENDKQQISLNEIGNDSYTVQKFVNAWKIDALRDVPVSRVNQYFNKSRENYMSGYNILAIFAAVVIIFGSLFFASGRYMMIAVFLAIILIIEQAVIFFFVDTPLGTWTPEGKEFHDKWKNFEKYLKDFSLIKERPPASIQVWGKYLVYATALGCADEVTENMKKYIKFRNTPESVLAGADVVSIAYFWGFYNMRSVFVPVGFNNPDMTSGGFDTGSFGDIGGPGSGGFGGGGGGVF